MLLLVALCAAGAAIYRYQYRITSKAFARINVGMTEDEVLWELGSPQEIVRRSPQDIWKYSDDPIIAWVYFHKNGHVAGIYYYDKHTGLQMGL
jgi:hypothetical protein